MWDKILLFRSLTHSIVRNNFSYVFLLTIYDVGKNSEKPLYEVCCISARIYAFERLTITNNLKVGLLNIAIIFFNFLIINRRKII
jgi:hypothetical protein